MLFYVIYFCCMIAAATFAACPSGSETFLNDCYVYQINSIPFSSAELDCNVLGGHLVSIHNGFVNTALIKGAAKYFDETTTTNFWIGLDNVSSPGNWIWTDRSTLDFTEFSSDFKPNNLSLNCGGLNVQTGLWESNDCVEPKPYVCRLPI